MRDAQIFKCRTRQRNKIVEWEGRMMIIRNKPPYEAIIESRGSSFHIICGSYQNGHYLSIPIWRVGADLATYDDEFWNFENIMKCGMSRCDSVTLAKAIHLLACSSE